MAVRDRASEAGRGSDSQADSHSVGHRQPLANVSGSWLLSLILRGRRWTLADVRNAVFKTAGSAKTSRAPLLYVAAGMVGRSASAKAAANSPAVACSTSCSNSAED